jgi:hypothetical protein
MKHKYERSSIIIIIITTDVDINSMIYIVIHLIVAHVPKYFLRNVMLIYKSL